MPPEKKFDHTITIAVLAFIVFVVQYLFRYVDDNRLTSWNWIFDTISVGRAYLSVVVAILIALIFSRFPLPGPRVLFVIAFLISSVFWREPEVIIDASRYFTQAKHLEIYGVVYFFEEWGRDIVAWTDLPLASFLFGIIFKFFGESRIYIQIFTTALFSATAVVTFFIGKDLFNESVGRSAGAFLLAIPYLYTQVPLMLVDVQSMFFLALAIFAFNRALTRGGVLMNALAVFAVILCVFSKYSLWLMLSALMVLFIVRVTERTIPFSMIFRRGIFIFLISGGIAGIVLLLKYGVISEQIRLLIDYQRPGLGRWTESFTSTFLFQTHPFVAAGGISSIYVAFRKKDIRYVIIAWLVVLMLFMQVKRIRYLVPTFPMLALIAGYGIQTITVEKWRRFLVMAAVSTSVALAVFIYIPFLEGFSANNIKNAGKYLDSMYTERIGVYTLTQKSAVNPAVAVPLLDLFTDKRLVYDYNETFLPKQFLTSPVRFTWLYENPRYYSSKGIETEEDVIVLIAGDTETSIPEDVMTVLKGYRKIKEFNTSSDLFRFKTFISVYKKMK